MRGRRFRIVGVASLVALAAVVVVWGQLGLGRPTHPVTTAGLAHFIVGASGDQGLRGAESKWPDLPLDTVIATVAGETWRLARDNAGGVDGLSAVCLAALFPTGFLAAPAGTMEQVALPGVRVVDADRCSFTSYDNVSYRTRILLRRRAWLLWVAVPEGDPEAGDAYTVETGYWAASLHGVSWRCRLHRGASGFSVNSCTVRWES